MQRERERENPEWKRDREREPEKRKCTRENEWKEWKREKREPKWERERERDISLHIYTAHIYICCLYVIVVCYMRKEKHICWKQTHLSMFQKLYTC